MFNGGFRIGPELLDRNIDGASSARSPMCSRPSATGIGANAGLMIDLNFSQRTEGFRRVAKAVEPYDLTWLEIDIHDPEGLALVRRSTSTPIASLEAIYGLRSYRPFFEEYAVDVAIVDVPWNGLSKSCASPRSPTPSRSMSRRIISTADLADLMSAHFCAAIPNFRIMEYEVDDVPWKHEFVTHPPVIEKGDLVIPTRPGWGADVNEEAMRAHPVKPR